MIAGMIPVYMGAESIRDLLIVKEKELTKR